MAEKTGAKLKLTPVTQTIIVKSVAAGLPMKYAAIKAGITEKSFHLWMQLGRKAESEPVYREFFQEIQKARVRALDLRIRRISRHGKANPRADQWWIENMFPDEFGADRKTVQSLAGRVEALTAELEALRAESGRTRKRSGKGRAKRKAAQANDGSHI